MTQEFFFVVDSFAIIIMNIRTINNRTSRLLIQLRNICYVTSNQYINSHSVMRNFFTREKTKLLSATTTVVTATISSSIYFSGRSYCAGTVDEVNKSVIPQIYQYKICPFCSRGSHYYI